MSDSENVCTRLQGDDIEDLRDAAYMAGEMRCVQAVPLLGKLLRSHNLGVQEAADMALREIGGREVVKAAAPLLRSDDAPVRNIAMDILREVGDQDFPTLLELLHDDDADIRIFTSDILGACGDKAAVAPLCETLLRDPEVNVRYQAAVSLGELGRPGAAKCLNKALNDEEWVQFAVIEALSKIRDASSVDALVKALDNSSDLVSSMIVEALGEIGNVKAVTMLLKRMDSSPPVLRNIICRAVVNILGGKSLTMLSEKERGNFRMALLNALADDDEDIQDAAIEGLAFVGGPKASAAVLELAARMDPDIEPERLDKAMDAISKIGMSEALENGVASDDPQLGAAAVAALAGINDPKVSPLLMDAFRHVDPERRRAISSTLARMAGEEAGDFFLEVLERVSDEAVLKDALAHLGGKMRLAAAGDRIFALLSHPDDGVKEAALEACTAINGPDMNERFKTLFSSDDPVDRLMAVYALGKMGVKDNLGLIVQALEDEVPDIRKIALEAVSELCPEHDRGMELIVSRLFDENRDVRLAVVEQLGKCGDPAGVPHLLQLLEDADDWVRIRALEALGAGGDRDVVPKITPHLDDPGKLVALKAAETLGELGGKAAFQALLAVVGGDDPELTAAAEEAIANIQDEQGD